MFGLGQCYEWEQTCGAVPDPCASTQHTTACADTQSWFWLIAAALAAGALLSRKKGAQ